MAADAIAMAGRPRLAPAELDALRRKQPGALNTLDRELEACRPEDRVQRGEPRITGR